MAFSDLEENVGEIHEETKAYIESSIKYYKLWGFKVAMQSTTMFVKFILVTICTIMMLLFLSVAGALAIGKALDNNVYGFLIIAGAYLIFFVLFLFIKPQIIEGSILRRFSKYFLTINLWRLNNILLTRKLTAI